MKEWTEKQLLGSGYEIRNAKITSVDLDMRDNGCMTLLLVIEGAGWGCCYGGRVLGKGYVGANPEFFEATGKGMIYIMRIMDMLKCDRFNDMEGKYIRVATKGFGSTVNIIGNIINDKWFDAESFFQKEKVDWHDLPTEEMDEKQLRAAVEELREYSSKLRGELLKSGVQV